MKNNFYRFVNIPFFKDPIFEDIRAAMIYNINYGYYNFSRHSGKEMLMHNFERSSPQLLKFINSCQVKLNVYSMYSILPHSCSKKYNHKITSHTNPKNLTSLYIPISIRDEKDSAFHFYTFDNESNPIERVILKNKLPIIVNEFDYWLEIENQSDNQQFGIIMNIFSRFDFVVKNLEQHTLFDDSDIHIIDNIQDLEWSG